MIKLIAVRSGLRTWLVIVSYHREGAVKKVAFDADCPLSAHSGGPSGAI